MTSDPDLPHRLTPPYMFVMGVVQLSMQHFHAHAVTELPARDHLTCPKYWWRNLLYVNTFFPNSQRVRHGTTAWCFLIIMYAEFRWNMLKFFHFEKGNYKNKL